MNREELDNYPLLEENLKNHFENATRSGKKLFKTNAENLFDTYLEGLPSEARDHYDCNCCRRFINRYGNLVTIDDGGNIETAMWDESVAPSFFRESVVNMRNKVVSSEVTGVFIAKDRVLGTSQTGKWSHLSVQAPTQAINHSRLLTAGQAMAEKREEFKMLTNALLEHPVEVAEQAVTLLSSGSLYRSGRFLSIAKWFKDLHNARSLANNSHQRESIVWTAVATAPEGFCHIKNSVVGALLDDLASELPIDSVKSRFDEKTRSSNYMRSQAEPTQGGIDRAEEIVEELGIANSLRRRYATLEEIPSFLWQAQGRKDSLNTGGVFGHITPKSRAGGRMMDLPKTVMTWEKFKRTVLPTSDKIEALVDNPNRFMALVTSSDEESENILQWDNPFSWYYHGGIDGEIKRRVEGAGGRYEDNEIRVSLMWDNYSDLDLHCITPSGEHIYYSNKRDMRSGGYLDVDMNVQPDTDRPVENIRWSRNALEGRYRFYVHNYTDRNQGHNSFKAELEINEKTYKFNGAVGTNGQVDIFTFDFLRGRDPNMLTLGSSHASMDGLWSAPNNEFVEVNGIATSPNLWGDRPVSRSGNHIFFLLDGVKDLSEGKGRGFFNEIIRSDLREIRKVLESYTANTPIEGSNKSNACGVGYSKDSEDWDLTLRVSSGNSTRLITIDRWD